MGVNNLQYRKELLFRKAKGKQLVDTYYEKIVDLFNVNINDIEFLSLEKSDEIRKDTSNLSKYISKRCRPNELNTILLEIKKQNNPSYIFIDHDWEYCGAFYIINIKDTINTNFKFGKLIKDDIVLIDTSFLKKIYIDFFEENEEFFIDYDIYK